jgi:hypothetical protein
MAGFLKCLAVFFSQTNHLGSSHEEGVRSRGSAYNIKCLLPTMSVICLGVYIGYRQIAPSGKNMKWGKEERSIRNEKEENRKMKAQKGCKN